MNERFCSPPVYDAIESLGYAQCDRIGPFADSGSAKGLGLRIDVDQSLRTLRQASMLLRATTGRAGMTMHIPPSAPDVVVAGDLHGNLDNLRAILQLADLEQHPGRHLVLQEFVHGTGRYPSGGCTSHRMLDLLAALKVRYPARLHLLLGNHELSQWTGRKVGKDGVYFNDLFEEGVARAYGERASEVVEAYDQLFSSMLLGVRLPNGVFLCHSIPESRHLDEFDPTILDRPGLTEEDLGKGSSAYRLVWGRDVSESTADRFAEIISADVLVTGHIAQPEGYGLPNHRQIILDSMASPAAVAVIPTSSPLPLGQLQPFVRLLPGHLGA
jgi:hypothetical protein